MVIGAGPETTHPSGSQLPKQLVPGEGAIVCCCVICKVEDVRLPDAVGIKDERRVFSTESGNKPSHADVSADFDNRGDSDAGEQVRSPSSNLLFHGAGKGCSRRENVLAGIQHLFALLFEGD